MLLKMLLLALMTSGAIFSDRRLAADRHHVRAHLVFEDFLLAGIFATGVVVLMEWLPEPWRLALTAGAAVLVLLWWCNGILFCATGFTLSPDNVRAAAAAWQTVWADAPLVFRTLRHKLWSLGGMLGLIASLVLLARAVDGPLFHWLTGLAVTGFVVSVSKSRVTRWTIVPLIALAAVIGWLSQWSARFAAASSWVAALAGGVLFLVVAHWAIRFGSSFWSRSSPLRSLLGGRGLRAKPDAFRFNPSIPPPGEVEPLPRTGVSGACAGQSVIFLALESAAAYAIADALRSGGSRFPFLCGLARRGLLSLDHYAISPNTNQAFEYIYRGGYPGEASYPYVEAMREAGYHTVLLTTQNLNDFERYKIVGRIGFDQVIDRKDGYFEPARQDYSLLKQVRFVADTLRGGKAFIHVMNNQTHTPYAVLDTERFGDTAGMGRKRRYLASLDEMDALFAEWFRRLGTLIDLDQVLIVISGDHGQSFGELGYDMHSSSTIKEQVKVPRWLVHPQLCATVKSRPDLRAAWGKRASHLDLMPTVCDLIDVRPRVPVRGRSVFDGDRPTDLFLHSEVTVKGIPAQMSWLRGERKWMTDLLNGVSYRMDAMDRIDAVLSREEEIELHAAFGATLRRLGFCG